MEQSHASSQSELETKQHALIQSCFQKTPALDSQELHAWYEEYKAVFADELDSRHTVIQAVQADPLDQNAIEQCILSLATNITISGRFCSDCSHLFSHWPDLGDPTARDPSTQRNWPGSGADWKHAVARECQTLLLEGAARKGCKFCAFLIQMIRDAGLLDTFRRIEARMVWLGDAGIEKGTEKASLSVQNWGMNTAQILWVNYPGKVCQHCNGGVAQEMKFESQTLEATADTYDGERDLSDIAKEWMDDCAKNHENCSKDEGNTLPTRLISIAGDKLKLVSTTGWRTKSRYSTLSHRWGNHGFLKLTEENYEALHTVIPDQELPKTFKDAVHISQQLGLEYLWIDSLCIVQGDIEDWRREASQMNSVYGNSSINIAAASAHSVHEGCFLKQPYLVDGLRAQISVAGSKYVRDFRSSSIYDLATTESHLATRAWALQERILPSRTIHFGHRGAFWECRSKLANEFLPDGFPKMLGSGLNDHRTRSDFDGWWWNVVRLYSAANLTFSRDKLPALSGVARSSYEERGGQYMAGMWRDEDIEAQLCWCARSPRLRPTWRAPSWSWISIDGAVLYTNRRRSDSLQDNYAHVLDVDVELLGQDPFGEVRGGCMRIACSGMLAATLSPDNTVTLDSDSDSAADVVYPIRPDSLDNGKKKHSDRVYLLPLIGGETGMRSSNKEENIWKSESAIVGLVLRRENDVAGHFCRVGMFEFFRNPMHRDREEEHLDPFLEALRQRGELMASSVCEEVAENEKDPREKYAVRIF